MRPIPQTTANGSSCAAGWRLPLCQTDRFRRAVPDGVRCEAPTATPSQCRFGSSACLRSPEPARAAPQRRLKSLTISARLER